MFIMVIGTEVLHNWASWAGRPRFALQPFPLGRSPEHSLVSEAGRLSFASKWWNRRGKNSEEVTKNGCILMG